MDGAGRAGGGSAGAGAAATGGVGGAVGAELDGELAPGSTRPPTVLLVGDPGLAELVAPAVAACGLRLQRAASCRDPAWRDARLVLLDGRVAVTTPPTRSPTDVVLLAGPVVGEDVWRAAVEHGAREVVRLPEESPRLLAALQAVADPDRRGAVVGVLGGCGGAGASVLAAVLAGAAAQRGMTTLLCDADPFGGGSDLLLGPCGAGLRWPDLASVAGPVRPGALRDAVPRSRDGCGVLSWSPGTCAPVAAEAVVAALAAGRGGHDLVVVDLPRPADPDGAGVCAVLDLLLLVVPARARAVSAAAAVLAAVRPEVADVRLVVRACHPAGLAARSVADALELPVTMRWPARRGLAAALQRGEPPGQRALGRAGRVLLHRLVAGPAGAAAASGRGRRSA